MPSADDRPALESLLDEERRRAERLRLLNEVAKEVVSSLDRDEMIGRVVRLCHRVFDFVHLSTFLLDDTTRELRLVAVAGRWAEEVPIGWSQHVDRGVIGRAVREARAYLSEDTAADPTYVPYPGIDSRTELAVPIIARGRVLGCMNAESHLVRAFDEEAVQVLSTVADQLASGIVNAKSYAEIEAEVRQKTRALTEANQEIARQKELLARENTNLRATLERRGSELIGASPKLAAVLTVADKAAASEATVLLEGESGTGKELVAARIHRVSRRAARPYVIVNCGAFPENLLESELFGHEAGAFTGAERRKPGLVETAEGGTLFLDEIGELPLRLQAKLLRFLQDGEFYRIGAKRPLTADVRVVSATNRDLRREVAAGRFREDLFHRLNTITLELPPLRDRPEDIPRLATWFLDRFRRGRKLVIGDLLMTALCRYHWPGNVRELANVIERLAILGDDGELGLEFVPRHIVEDAARAAERSEPGEPIVSLRDLEREHIRHALARNGGDKPRTARELGIALKTLYNKIGRYGIIAALAVALTAPAAAFAGEGATATASAPAVEAHAPAPPSARSFRWTVGLASATKNLSLGFASCYLGYVETAFGGDWLVSAILNGFDHDDLDSIRFNGAQTVGARLTLRPFGLRRRCGAAPAPGGRWPAVVPGVGLWGVTEVDSITQAFRVGDAGFFGGWSVGVFTSFVFRDITVTFLFRPFEQTTFYLDGDWDSTGLRFGNPTLEIDLSYALPW